jgi:hypothetical protein
MKKDEKKTIYFHIGSNKAGSSAIQAFCSENSTILEKKGIYYPPQPEYCMKEFKVSSGNAPHLFSDCDQYPLNENGEARINYILSLTQKHSKILLSSEALWFIEDKTTFFNNFKKENIEIVVIAYLRRQDEYLESAINQRIKVSKYKTVTYPECLNPNNILLGPLEECPLEELDYYKVLEKIKLSIGVSNIIVRPYEKEQFKSNNIFSDFLSIFNLELTNEYIMPPKEVNPRLNRDFLEMKKICNSLPIDNLTLLNVFSEPLMKLSANKESALTEFEYSLFSYQEKLDIMNKCDESNKKIAIEYLGRMDGKLFINSLPKNNENSKPFDGPSIENVIKTFGYLVCKQAEEMDELKKHKDEQDLKIAECIKKIEENSYKISMLAEENKKLLDKHNILEDKFENTLSEYYRLLNSKSWRITKPLRVIRNLFK